MRCLLTRTVWKVAMTLNLSPSDRLDDQNNNGAISPPTTKAKATLCLNRAGKGYHCRP